LSTIRPAEYVSADPDFFKSPYRYW